MDVLQNVQSLKGYIYQITKNATIDFLRRKKVAISIDDANFVETWPDQYDSNPINPYLVKQAVERVLAKQKPKNREIFEMHKFEGLTYGEIAEYLNISKRSVEDNISRTIAALKEELRDHSEFFD